MCVCDYMIKHSVAWLVCLLQLKLVIPILISEIILSEVTNTLHRELRWPKLVFIRLVNILGAHKGTRGWPYVI